jgi:dTDP-D-glucose 4,6-dehydratase
MELEKELGAPVELRFGACRPGDLQRSVLDASYCESVIGKATSLEDGLRETARWFKARG